ncbi:MAG: DUF1456 family protein [Bacteroidota bacterium]|nr:DUF1456 family protein [Bacteroidota bacterium]
MTNNDIFKKLRVALQLRDDEIVEIMNLVDFRISKSELGAFFRAEDHPNYKPCGDQILRNFLNGLVIHFRGTKDNPKDNSALQKLKSAQSSKDSVNKKHTTNTIKKQPKTTVNAIKFKNGKKTTKVKE